MTGRRRAWVEAGPPSGSAVLLVPPLGATHETWNDVATRLARHRRVVQMDLRGHGAAPARPLPASIADLGRDILAVMDEARLERAAICGTSLGAMGAMWAAARSPARVEALVLWCTSAKLGPSEAWLARAALVRGSGMAAVASAVAGRWVTSGWARRHPVRLRRLAGMVEAVDPDAYAGWCDAIAAMDLRPELPSITSPTLVAGGAEDAAIPLADLRDIAARVRGARLAILPDAAHHPAIEQPAAVAALILDHLDHLGEIADAS